MTETAIDPRLIPAARTHALRATDRWFVVAVLLAFVAVVYQETVGSTTVIFIGTYNFTAADPVFVVAGLALLKHLLDRPLRIRDMRALFLLIFVLLIGLSFFRGLLVNAFDSAFSLRNTGVVAIFCALTLFYTSSSSGLVYSRRILIAAGCVLTLLLIVRLIFGPGTFYQGSHLAPSQINDGGRGLAANACVVIAAAAVTVLSDVRRTPRFATGVVFVLLWGGLLASRQVTATLAGCAGIAVILLFERGPARLARQLVCVGAVGLFAYGSSPVAHPPSALVADTPSSTVANAPSSPVGNANAPSPPVEQSEGVTADVSRRLRRFEARRLIWKGFVADYLDWSVVDQLVGLPAGVKPRIWLPLWGGVFWKLSIHSMYFGTLVYAGALGLIAYIGILIHVSATAATNRPREWSEAVAFTPATALAFSVILAVYGVSYEIRNEVSIILTLAAAATNAPRSGVENPQGASSSLDPVERHAGAAAI